MPNVILTNDFHNTSVVLRCETLSHICNEVSIRPNRSQIKRSKKALCGLADCTCSGDDGTRGIQRHNGKCLIVDLSALYTGVR